MNDAMLHVFLCPMCSTVNLEEYAEDDAVEGEHVLIASEPAYEPDIGEHGYSKGIYLTIEGVIACLNRHEAEALEELKQHGKKTTHDDDCDMGVDCTCGAGSDAEAIRDALFGGAVVPANWKDMTGGQLLTEVGGEDDG